MATISVTVYQESNEVLTIGGGSSGLTPEQETELTGIKAKTDLLNFTGTDIKATLDGESVVTDTASRNASKSDVSSLSTAASIAALNDISTNDIDLRLNAYDAPTKAELDSAVAPLSIFNPASDTVTTDTASREASKANVSALSTAINIAALNNLSTADIDSLLSAYDSPTKAELDSAVSGLSTFDPTATSVTTDTASRLASQNDLALISADAAETRKRVSNRRKIDSIANTETVFDDDNTTPLYVSDLKDKDGNPSSDSPFEIVPQ